MSEYREHITDGKPCWCGPTFERVNGEAGVWVHRQLPPCPDCSSPLRQAEKAVIEAAKNPPGWIAGEDHGSFLRRYAEWATNLEHALSALSRLDEGGK